MKKLIRRLSRLTHSKSAGSDVPAGHLPVYAGLEHMERFIVRANLLRHPIFLELLDCAAQEYGYDQNGVLKIPVNADLFERVLHSLLLGLPLSSLDDVVRSAPPIQVR